MKKGSIHKGPRKAAIVFIFITVALDVLALGIIIPVLPKLVLSLMGGDTVSSAKMYGLFGTVFALMQFFFSPILGSLSDRYGRRPVVLLSNFGLGFDYILMALAPTISWLFVGRVLSGITAASIPTAFAYIADVTPTKKRAAGFGMIGAAFGLGFVLGPALGGVLGGVDPRLPFWVAAGLSLLNGVYGLFVLPESLAKNRRSPFEWVKANPIGSLSLLKSHPGLLNMSFIGFLNFLAHDSLPSVFVLYTGFRYGWDEKMVGLALAAVGVGAAVVQGGMVGSIVKRWGERRALLAGLFFGVVGFAIYGWAPTALFIWLGLPFISLWGLTGPSLQGLMTRHVSPKEQGRLQGANNSLRGISAMIGPGLFTMAFATCIGANTPYPLPGVAFMMASFLLIAALSLAVHVRKNY